MRSTAKTPTARGLKHGWDAPPALEWAAAGLGLLTSVGAIAYILWIAVQPMSPPRISVHMLEVEQTAGGYIVQVEVRNAGRATAAAVEIEGALELGADDETRTAAFDYVPGQGRRKAALVFEHDPRKAPLSLRATGYTKP